MTHPLDSFFAPSSIAIIGASRDPAKIPGILLALLRKNEFPGEIYPVNPNYPDIGGLACYPSVGAIGRPIDLAVVIIPARAVLGSLRECADAGVRNAVVISSGFGEEGGDGIAMQQAIADFASASGMRISGPNAEGFFNEPGRIAATFSPTVDVKPDAPRLLATRRRIGIVAQSGGIGFAIYNRARALGIALSIAISTGNESDLGAGECLDYMVQDPSTDVILMFIEGVRDTGKFLAAAQRAAEAGKPVIMAKVGRSGAGERAAASHTASMAGWTAAYDAVFAKYGMIVCNDLDEAVSIAAVLTTCPAPKGDRVAVITVSGGAGIWGADAVSAQGLQVPELSPSLQASIRALIPSYGSARNPVDITAQAVHTGGLQKTMDLLDRSDEIDIMLLVISVSSETRMPFKIPELKALIDAQNKPVVFYSYTLPSNFARTELAAAGITVLTGLTHVGTALRHLVRRQQFRPPAKAALPAIRPLDLTAHPGAETLSEFDSKSLLRDAGVSLPVETLVTDKASLDAALDLAGFPLVMKIQSRDIPHKSEVGGVRVNIATRDEARAAYDHLLKNAAAHRPNAAIQGVLVGPMAKTGVEIIVGTMLDATFGPMIMVGLGGVTAELFKDVIYRPAPVSAPDALAMLDELKAAPLLHGFRGAAPADVPALANLISRISLLASGSSSEIAEIELNPVLVHGRGEGVTIVDALVVPK